MAATVRRRHHVGRRTRTLGGETVQDLDSACDTPDVRQTSMRNTSRKCWAGTNRRTPARSFCIVRTVVGNSSWADAAASIGLEPDPGRRNARATSAGLRVSPEVFADTVQKAQQLLSPGRSFRRLEEAVRTLAETRELWFDKWCASTTPKRGSAAFPYAITWMWCTFAQGVLDTSPAWHGPVKRQSKAAFRVFSNRLPAAAGERLKTLVSALSANERPALERRVGLGGC